MDEYLKIFIEDNTPSFLNKYINTKTLKRLKGVTQFCGADYTKLFSTSFTYTRYDHSVVVALITWHFTHNKKETIAAVLHDAGTPCFAHCIDYVFGDYMKQESSEKDLSSIIKNDKELMNYLKEDNVSLEELDYLEQFPILENKSPKLCADRLDGVLHTCFIWVHTHSLDEIKEVYDDMTILTNEDGKPEMGFKSLKVALKFVKMVYVYAKEIKGNTDKYVMKYISEIVKLAFQNNLISMEDLYIKSEQEIVSILENNFESWNIFKNASSIIRIDEEPNLFYIPAYNVKKRNTIPLVKVNDSINRINNVSKEASLLYEQLDEYKDSKYAYVKSLKRI